MRLGPSWTIQPFSPALICRQEVEATSFKTDFTVGIQLGSKPSWGTRPRQRISSKVVLLVVVVNVTRTFTVVSCCQSQMAALSDILQLLTPQNDWHFGLGTPSIQPGTANEEHHNKNIRKVTDPCLSRLAAAVFSRRTHCSPRWRTWAQLFPTYRYIHVYVHTCLYNSI